MDGRLLMAGIDWRQLSPVRLVNVLSWLMLQDASTDGNVMKARLHMRDLLDGLGEGSSDATVDTTPVNEQGIPMNLREQPLG